MNPPNVIHNTLGTTPAKNLKVQSHSFSQKKKKYFKKNENYPLIPRSCIISTAMW